MVIARKRPKGRLIRARVFSLCLYVLVILVLFVFLFGISVFDFGGLLVPGLIGLTAAFVLLMLPVAWKALDEDLARYRLARLQVIGGRKLFPYVGAGLAFVIVMSIVTVWYSIGRSRIEVMQQLALPFVVALAAYDLVSFWIVDRKAMRYILGQTRVGTPREDG